MGNSKSNKISLLSKFKPQIHRIEVLEDWVQYSLDTDAIAVLDAIAEVEEIEDKVKIAIPILKRFGIHPSENELIKEVYDSFKEIESQFFNFLDKVSQDTGLTRVEVLLRIPEDLNSLQIEVEKELKDSENSDTLEIREKLAKIKNKLKSESKEISQEIGEYLPELNRLSKIYEESRIDYFFHLLSVFLSGKRNQKDVDSPVEVSIEIIKTLHIDLQRELVGFIQKEINGWDDSEKK